MGVLGTGTHTRFRLHERKGKKLTVAGALNIQTSSGILRLMTISVRVSILSCPFISQMCPTIYHMFHYVKDLRCVV